MAGEFLIFEPSRLTPSAPEIAASGQQDGSDCSRRRSNGRAHKRDVREEREHERRINRYRNGVPLTDRFHSRMSDGNVIVGNTTHRQQCGQHFIYRSMGCRRLNGATWTSSLRNNNSVLCAPRMMRPCCFRSGVSQEPPRWLLTTRPSQRWSIRAVDLESGKIRWTGSAHYRDMRIKEPGDSSMTLTCQALATAWGFREPGDIYIPSQQMCTLRDTRPIAD